VSSKTSHLALERGRGVLITKIPRPMHGGGRDEQPHSSSLSNLMRKHPRASPNTCANAPGDAQQCTKAGLTPCVQAPPSDLRQAV
jgi:hypothetical protein